MAKFVIMGIEIRAAAKIHAGGDEKQKINSGLITMTLMYYIDHSCSTF